MNPSLVSRCFVVVETLEQTNEWETMLICCIILIVHHHLYALFSDSEKYGQNDIQSAPPLFISVFQQWITAFWCYTEQIVFTGVERLHICMQSAAAIVL